MGSADNRAEVRLSDLAPNEAVYFSFATDEFGLSGKKIYRTDDEVVIAEADAHPWLTVKRPEVPEDALMGAFREPLSPEDDHLSLLGSSINPNDPAEVEKAEAAKLVDMGVNVALDINKDQSEPVLVDDTVAETLAADPTSKTADKASSDTTKDKD